MPGEPPSSEVAARPRRGAWRTFLHRRRVVVFDESMMPTLRAGDRLLVDTAAYRDRPPDVGEIVVLVDPEQPSRWLVKRVVRVDPSADTVDVRGDSTETARDSRRFGPVPFRSVVGRVYRIYFPPARRRDL